MNYIYSLIIRRIRIKTFSISASKASHLQEAELKMVSPAECESLFLREHSQTLRRWYPQLLQGSDIMCAGAPGKSACEVGRCGPGSGFVTASCLEERPWLWFELMRLVSFV